MTLLLSPLKWLAAPAAVAVSTLAGVALVGTPGPGPNPAPPPQVAAPLVPDAKAADETRTEDGLPKVVRIHPNSLLSRGTTSESAGHALRPSDPDPKATFRPIADGENPQNVSGVTPKVVGPVPPDGGRAPSPATPGGPDSTVEELQAIAVPPVVARGKDGMGNDRFELGPVHPDYFNLPAADPTRPGSPQPVKVGQAVRIDVLEALPGRPLSGERVVRTDGTISLGFYGDLYVLGLDRDQIKAKLLEKLRVQLNDDLLGLVSVRDGKVVATPIAENNRVFVDDQPGPASSTPKPAGRARTPAAPEAAPAPIRVGQAILIEVLQGLPGRPIGGERVVRADGTISLGFYGDLAVAGLTRGQVKEKVIEHLRAQLSDAQLGLVERDAQGREKRIPPLESTRVFVDEVIPARETPAATAELVEKLSGQVADLSGKLDRALGAIEQLRRDQAAPSRR